MMPKRRFMAVRSLLVFWVMSFSGCSCSGALVGAECADGYTECAGRCVNTALDTENCGLCGRRCNAGVACTAGVCSGSLPDDGGNPDLDAAGDSATDALPTDGSNNPDGSTVDSGTQGCPIGTSRCGTQCYAIDNDPNHCGNCNTSCSGATPICVTGVCQSTCPLPRQLCSGRCIDTLIDPDNCGSCGLVCATGRCADGGCIDDVAGRVVVIGHDYTGTLNTSMRQLIARAVLNAFDPTGSATPVRVMAYDRYAEPASVAAINGAVTSVLGSVYDWGVPAIGANGDPVLFADIGSDANYTTALASNDVFIIYPQYNATNGELVALRNLWDTALSDFLDRGKVVVLLDAPTTNNSGTYQILQSFSFASGLQSVDFTGLSRRVQTVAESDSVMFGISSPYLAGDRTIGFAGAKVGIVAVEQQSGTPVVIHIGR